MDTLLLPSSGMKNATVRWVPGPVEVTGTGYALLHCHMMPHSDEGCIMKTQILDKRCAPPVPAPAPPPARWVWSQPCVACICLGVL